MMFPREIMILILEWKSKFEVGARFKANAKKLDRFKALKLEAGNDFYLANEFSRIRINDKTTLHIYPTLGIEPWYTIHYSSGSFICNVMWISDGETHIHSNGNLIF